MKSNNNTQKEDLNLSKGDNSIFSNSVINNILTTSPKRLRRTTQIYNYIYDNPGCTPYHISKKLKINYTDVHRCIQDLHHASMISIKVILDEENSRAKKTLFAFKEVKDEKENK